MGAMGRREFAGRRAKKNQTDLPFVDSHQIGDCLMHVPMLAGC